MTHFITEQSAETAFLRINHSLVDKEFSQFGNYWMLPFNCEEIKDSNPFLSAFPLDEIFPDGQGRRQMKPVSASTPGTISAIKWGSGLCTFYNKYANAAELPGLLVG